MRGHTTRAHAPFHAREAHAPFHEQKGTAPAGGPFLFVGYGQCAARYASITSAGMRPRSESL